MIGFGDGSRYVSDERGAVVEIPGFGWISIPHGWTMDDEGEDHRAGLAGGSSPHEPREQPMSEGRTDLGPCAVCTVPVYDEDGASFSFEGEVIHPWGSECYAKAWGDRMPLSERNVKTAENIGRMIAMGRDLSGTSHHVEVMLWLRNLTPTDRKPPDGVVFEWSRHPDDDRVMLIRNYQHGAVLELDEDDEAWIPLDEAAARVDEWSQILPVVAGRALLSTFITIVREVRNVTSKRIPTKGGQ